MNIFILKGTSKEAAIQLEEVESADAVLSDVVSNQNQVVFVLPFDAVSGLKKYSSLKKNKLIKIVVVCEPGDTEKLVAHQKRNRGADMYLPAPLSADYLSLIKDVFQAEPEKSSLSKSTSSFAEDPSIKFDLSSIEDELAEHKVTDTDSVGEDHGIETVNSLIEEDEEPRDLANDPTIEIGDDLFETEISVEDSGDQESDRTNTEEQIDENDDVASLKQLQETTMSENKKVEDELGLLNLEADDGLTEEAESEELEFEGAPADSGDSDTLMFEVSGEDSSFGSSLEDEDNLIDDDELMFDTEDEVSAPEESSDEKELDGLVEGIVTDPGIERPASGLDGDIDLESGDLSFSESDDDPTLEKDNLVESAASNEAELADEVDLGSEGGEEISFDLSATDTEISSSGEESLGSLDESVDLDGGSTDELKMEDTVELTGETSELEKDFSDENNLEEDFDGDDPAQLPSDDDLDFPEMPAVSSDNGSLSDMDHDHSLSSRGEEGDIEAPLSESSSASVEDTVDNDLQREFDYKTNMQKIPKEASATFVDDNIAAPTKTFSTSSSDSEGSEEALSSERPKILADDVEKIFHQFEMMKAQKEHLQKELEQERENLRRAETELMNLRDLSEELKVENKILKKRFERKDDDYRKQYELSEEKRKVIEGKYRLARQKLEDVEAKNRATNSSNRSVEKNLESKIELMEVDFRSQIGAREEKITELRRSNEALEFNLESLAAKNQELLARKKEIEERLSLVISSLRGSIDLIEEDQSALLEEIKKNEKLDGY